MKSKITTVEEAFKARGLNPEALPDVSGFPEYLQKYILNHFKLLIVIEAVNEGWIPNWNDHNQTKYFPWFEVEANKENPSGVGFSDTFCAIWTSDSSVGSRLCLETREKALYVAEQFSDLYKENQLIFN